MELKNVQRIGVFKLRNIGDVLMVTPLLHALKQTFPAAHLTAIVNVGTEAMLANNPDVDDVIVYRRNEPSFLRRELDFLRAVRRARFDLTLTGTEGDRSAWCSLLSGARYRLGVKSRKWGRFDLRRRIFNLAAAPSIPGPMHEVERHFFFAEAAGLRLKTSTPGPLVLKIPPDLRRWAEEQLAPLRPARIIHVHPVSRWLWKCWDNQAMAAVIDWLQDERGTRVVVTTGPVERERTRARAIVALCRTQPLFFDGNLNLTQLAAISAASDGYFGIDTAPMHIAAAVGVPVLVLFGPTGPESWGPWNAHGRVLSAACACKVEGRAVCDWSAGAVRACMASISVEQVQAALDELLPTPA
jgi:heptosyltransferase-3